MGEALATLQYTPKAAARLIEKVLRSAIANAEHNHQVRNLDDLRVVKAMADGGPVAQARVSRAPWAARSSSSTGRATSPSSWPRRDGQRSGAAAPGRGAAPAPERRPRGQERRGARWARRHIRSGSGWASTRTWSSRWFATKGYADLLHEDVKIRRFIKSSLYHAGISRIDIERSANRARITIYTARPGIIIGRKGAEVEKLKNEICRARTGKEVYLNIEEVVHPELDAQLVAENVALQLQKRVAFRRAMKKAVTSALRLGADGIRIACSGRLGGGRDRAARVVPRRPGAAPHAPGRHRLRARRGPHHVRDHRREGVDLQGRGAARRVGAAEGLGPPMLMPKRVKYRKAQRGRMKGTAHRGSTLAFGEFGLKALEPGWVTNRQIEAGARGARPAASSGAARSGSASSRTSR